MSPRLAVFASPSMPCTSDPLLNCRDNSPSPFVGAGFGAMGKHDYLVAIACYIHVTVYSMCKRPRPTAQFKNRFVRNASPLPSRENPYYIDTVSIFIRRYLSSCRRRRALCRRFPPISALCRRRRPRRVAKWPDGRKSFFPRPFQTRITMTEAKELWPVKMQSLLTDFRCTWAFPADTL